MHITVHPFYLTWENRKYVEKNIDNFDVQICLEDDIGFNAAAFEYWLRYKDICMRNNYNLGFLRTEMNATGEQYITDLTVKLNTVKAMEDQQFLVNDNNAYCGFWIYDKKELKEFIKTKEWKFNFNGYGIREKSAIGWHGIGMKRYKGTLIPLEKNQQGLYETPAGCGIHHIPNNYIGPEVFCKIKFPIVPDA